MGTLSIIVILFGGVRIRSNIKYTIMHPTNSHLRNILEKILEELKKIQEQLEEIKNDSRRTAARKKDTV